MMLRRMPLEENPAEGHPSILRHLPRGRSLRDATPRLSDALGVMAGALRSLDGRKHLFLFGIGTDLGGTVVSALNRSNIDVYPVDITPPNIVHLQAASLRALARDTDGQYFAWWGPLQSLRHVSRQTGGYYQVSLLAPEDWDERDAQELRVKVRDPDLRVRSRRRYPPAEVRAPEIHTRGES
jgi:hypothetical protein